jgi:hypothetical protein
MLLASFLLLADFREYYQNHADLNIPGLLMAVIVSPIRKVNHKQHNMNIHTPESFFVHNPRLCLKG